MVLSKESIEKEIKACEAAIIAHRDGLEINQIVLEAFNKELKNLPKKKNG